MKTFTTDENLRTKKNIIYKIVNLINGKIYIGKSKNTFYQRYRGKWWTRIQNPVLIKSVKKYGYENFSVEIIEDGILIESDLNEKEIFYIKTLNSLSPNGYNLHSGGINFEKSELSKINYRNGIRKNRPDLILIKNGIEFRFKIVSEFAQEFGLNRKCVSAIFQKRVRSYQGFHLPETDLRFYQNKDKLRILVKDGIKYEVYNVETFSKEHGLKSDCLSQIFRGIILNHRGFHLEFPRRKKIIKRFATFGLFVLVKGENWYFLNSEEIKNFCIENSIKIHNLTSCRVRHSNFFKIAGIFDKNLNQIRGFVI